MNIKQLQDFYRQANQFSGGRLGILRKTLKTFSDARASQAAASLAYYAIFSLFPLLLVLIAGSSFFLNSQQVYQSVTRLVQDTFPIATQLINQNLRQVLDARGPVGLIGLLTLLWSASGVFTNLAYNVNLAWSASIRRSFLKRRLVGLAMIAILGGLLILSLALDSISKLLGVLNIEKIAILKLVPWDLLSGVGSWVIIFLLFVTLYHWVPLAKVCWKATFWGAFTAMIGWKGATAVYNWYVSSGLGRYQLVYGSLGAIVALLFLIYLLAMITLFGAHLSAAIDCQEDQKTKNDLTDI